MMNNRFSIRLKRIPLSGLLFALAMAGVLLPSRADNIALNSSAPGPTPTTGSCDSIAFSITLNSAANQAPTKANPNPTPVVAPGTYHVHFGNFGDPQFTVKADGTIQNDLFYGMPTTFSNNGYSITFSWTYNDTAWTTCDDAADYNPPYPYNPISAQPPYEYLRDTQSESFFAEGPLPVPPGKQFWNRSITIQDFFYHNWVWNIYGDKTFKTHQGDQNTGSDVVRPAQSFIRHYVVKLPAGSDQSPPPCSGGCSSCSPKMATYSFDSLRGSLRVMDTPVSYSPPVGAGMGFTITYNQGDVGQEPLPFLSNLGNQFTYGYLSYISNTPASGAVTRFVPGGGLENYPDFNASTASVDIAGSASATSAPERNSHAVLSWNGDTQIYTLVLPDGSSQVYGRAVTDPNGVPLFLITSQTDAQGNTLTYGYDSLNRLVSLTDALNQITTFGYQNGDQYKITLVTDPFGRSARFQYDSQGRLTYSTDTMGLVSNYGYDATNFLNQLTTPYGTTTFTTDFDAFHHGVNATNPLNQTERIEVRYNSVPTIADTDTVPAATNILATATGLSSGNSYYWTRRQYTATPDYTQATITHWMKGSAGLTDIVDSVKKPLEGRVWYNYQGQTQPDYLSDEASSSPTLTARLLDGGATQASYATYTSTGLITQSVDPRGRTTNYNYDPNNGIDLLTVTQTNGAGQDLLSTMAYNSQHEPLTSVDASGQTTTMTYNAAGQPLTRQNPKLETTTMAYDTKGYLLSVTGPVSGAKTTYTYDSFGRVATIQDSEGYVTTSGYDASDRPTSISYPDGTSDQTFYANLDVDHTVDRQGRVTRNTYDAIRELLTTTDPLGRTTQYSWCTCGGLSTLKDANGNVTTWNLDIMGRVTGKVYADSSQITYTYENNLSRLHSMTDANGNGATYSYNSDNTLASTAYTPGSGIAATPNVSFTYDTPYNRVLTMVDGSGVTTYSYNAITGTAVMGAGRLSGLSAPVFGTGKTAALTYAYDALGRVVTRGIDQATTNANNVATTFDTLGRVTNVSNPLGAFVYAYVNATSRLSGVTYPTGTGLSTSYSYYPSSDSQDFERLQGITNLKGSTQLSNFQYTYNPVGTIAKWTQQSDSSTAVVNTLSYDGADQLTGNAQSGGATTAYGYAYDPSGNRLTGSVGSTTTVGQFNNLNQLKETTTSATSTTVAGHTSAAVSSLNVNAVPATITGSTNFTANVPLPSGTNIFSVVARPTSGSIATQKYQVVTTGSAPTVLSYDKNGNVLTDENGNKYQWDALNRLTKITYPVAVGGNSTFAYDGLSRRVQIVDTTSGGIVTTKNYLWIGSEIAEERNASNAVTKRFLPQGEQQAGANYYYTKDHLGSTRELLDGSGTLLTRYGYDSFGRTTTSYLSGTHDATFQWDEMMRHQASNLYLTRNVPGLDGREYNTDTGDWISRDAAGERGGINLYGYCGNNPILYRDTFGLACGVVVKQLYPSLFRGGDLVGHEWIEWPGGSAGFWPGKGCASPFVAPPVEEVPDEMEDPGLHPGAAKEALTWATEKVDTGEIQAGPDKGTKCCKATCAQIVKCMMFFQITQQYNLFTHNCYGGVSDRLNACCLTKSNMMAQHGGRGKGASTPGN